VFLFDIIILLGVKMYERELRFMKHLVKQAEKIAKKGVSRKKSKGIHDYATDRDVAVESYLIRTIKQKYPKDGILSEELCPNSQLKNRTWIIDPIDGTLNFMEGNPDWCIQIALYDDDDIVASIISIPYKKVILCAERGKGCFINGKRFKLNDKTPFDEALIEFGSNFKGEYGRIQYELMKQFSTKGAKVRICGSSGISLAGLLIDFDSMCVILDGLIWDYSMGSLIVEEAGAYLIEETVKGHKIKLYCTNVDTYLRSRECVKAGISEIKKVGS